MSVQATKTIQAVVFDAFGTTISYGGERTNPYRLLLDKVQDKNATAQKINFLTANKSIETFAHELGKQALLPMIEEQLQAELAGLCLFAEVETLLSQLKARGLKIAVCSNLAHAYGDTLLRLLPQMDAYILSYEVHAAKPQPQIYKAVCDALELAPEVVFFTGDSKRCDVQGPKNYGMQSAWLNRREGMTLFDALPPMLCE